MEIAQNSDDEMTSDLLLGIYTELEKRLDATCVLESIIDLKAAARSEQEGVGTPDYEALLPRMKE